ncbi:MAG: FGGY-family carbohydrate kinase, partial [Cellulosilyticaceae bacterium]
DSKIKLTTLKVDGGACANNFLMQFQSDLLGVQVDRPQVIETTALGAAYLAGLAVGYWKDRADTRTNWALAHSFTCQMSDSTRTPLLSGWHKATSRSRDWIDH